MQDVDLALAKLYGTRASSSRDADRAASTPRARTSVDQKSSGKTPPPHFTLDSSDPAPTNTISLRWPSTVRTLEREHGDRFERLADHLLAIRDQRQLRVLLFTSCHRAEGRTTLVLTLARALARRPGRILIVDGDLSGPMLATQLGLTPRVGLQEIVESGVAASDAILDAADDHLYLLPLRRAVDRPRDFMTQPGWSLLMARLRREFDLVLLDGSPLFAGLSAAVLHRSVDAAILVHNQSLTTERALLRAQEVLEAGGIPLLGLAETFV